MSSHAEDGMLLAYKRLRTAYDVSLAANQRLEDENQRLREALEWLHRLSQTDTNPYVHQKIGEALAGDAKGGAALYGSVHS